MPTRSSIVHALLGPIALFSGGTLVVWQIASTAIEPALWIAISAIVACALLLRAAIRRRQLRPLLIGRQLVRKTTLDEMHVRRDEPGDWKRDVDYESDASEDELVARLGSRRLVILCGERGSGRARTAFEALQRGFGPYTLLRPVRGGDKGRPPLTTLLTSGVLSFHRRYALWLGDIGGYVNAGTDPRVIERWLATGRLRVAIGTITPDDLERIERLGLPAWASLDRAVQIHVRSPRIQRHTGSATRRYRHLGRDAEDVIRAVAMCELLMLPHRGRALINTVLERWTGHRSTDGRLDWLQQATPSLLSVADGNYSVHPEVLDILDKELSERPDAKLLGALLDSLTAPGLLAAGQALAMRGRLTDAQTILRRARTLGGAALYPSITTALVSVDEMKQGSSGANFSNAGGWDFAERMGPQQKESAARLLPSISEGGFDPSLPPEGEGFSTRFYRLTVYRGLARVGMLVAIDGLSILVASIAALAVRAAAQQQPIRIFSGDLVTLVVPGIFVAVAAGNGLGLYRADAARARPHLILVAMGFLSVVVAAAFLIAGVDPGSLAALATLFAVAAFLDWLLRYGYDVVSRRWVRDHHLQRRVLILGPPGDAHACAVDVSALGGRPVQPVAFLSKTLHAADPFCVGTYEQLSDRLHELYIAEVIIVDRALSTAKKAKLVDLCQRYGLDVRFVPSPDENLLSVIGRVDDLSLVHLPATLMTPEALALKLMLDYVVITATLPLWTGLIGLYWCYSKLRRPGQPVFVVADRVGLGNVGFSAMRLRTRRMYPDGKRGRKPSGRVEAWFERTGLDEIPQVVNVLRREMSIVGPRPLGEDEHKALGAAERRTLNARPGLTGRWQVAVASGADESDMRMLDAEYLRRWRVSHDLELIIRTPLTIARRGFYLGDTALLRLRRPPASGLWSERSASS